MTKDQIENLLEESYKILVDLEYLVPLASVAGAFFPIAIPVIAAAAAVDVALQDLVKVLEREVASMPEPDNPPPLVGPDPMI